VEDREREGRVKREERGKGKGREERQGPPQSKFPATPLKLLTFKF